MIAILILNLTEAKCFFIFFIFIFFNFFEYFEFFTVTVPLVLPLFAVLYSPIWNGVAVMNRNYFNLVVSFLHFGFLAPKCSTSEMFFPCLCGKAVWVNCEDLSGKGWFWFFACFVFIMKKFVVLGEVSLLFVWLSSFQKTTGGIQDSQICREFFSFSFSFMADLCSLRENPLFLILE